MSYPEQLIKGIPNNDFISDGLVGSHLFYFDAKNNRDDGWCEQSINWHDDSKAIEHTLKQKKDTGEIQFKAGLGIIKRNEIDILKNRSTVSGFLSYERDDFKGNKYHGNLLLKAEADLVEDTAKLVEYHTPSKRALR